MSINFKFSNAALDDLNSIYDYTSVHWGLKQAEEYTAEIYDACSRLAETPLLALDASEIKQGYKRYLINSHCIYFIHVEHHIKIIRILHQRMKATHQFNRH